MSRGVGLTMPPRILVVDDEPSVADLIEAVLSGEGYTVAIARDGAQGLMLARDWSPDLILMDIMLPA
ncbi:MAG: response regulator transcription factor, partial [Thermomicrobiales bacterium]